MKFFLLIISFVIIISTSIFSETLSMKGQRLYLWNNYKLQFGTYEFKIFDHIDLKKQNNVYTFTSNKLYDSKGNAKNIETKAVFVDHNDFIKIDITTTFNEKTELRRGFGMFISNIENHYYTVSNHATSFNSTKPFVEGYNTITFESELSLYFANPLNQHLQFIDGENYLFVESVPAAKTRFSETKRIEVEDIRQIMDKGEVVKLSFIISKEDASYRPVITAIPNGHTEAITLIWDEIPMRFESEKFSSFTKHKENMPITYQRMRELFNYDPKYKANFLISFDYVDNLYGYDRVDTSNGMEHYEVTGPYDITNNPPETFVTWLGDIENNRSEEWTRRTSLGFHSLHHTYIDQGVVQHMSFHEFDCLDSIEATKTMDRVYKSLPELGLTEKSMKAMRFPGTKFSDCSWQEMVERDIDFLDLGFSYNLNNEHNFSKFWGRGNHKSWGVKTAYWGDYEEGDTKDKYAQFFDDLKKGFPLLMGGHPNPTVGGNRHDAYKFEFFKSFLDDIENNMEDVVFLLPDSIPEFWDKLSTVDIDSINRDSRSTMVYLSGEFHNNFTIVLPDLDSSNEITAYNCSIKSDKFKRTKHYITLHEFKGNSCIIVIDNPNAFEKKVDKTIYNEIKINAAPNPSTSNVRLLINARNRDRVTYSVMTNMGLTLSKKTIDLDNGFGDIDISTELKDYKGVFFVVVEDDFGVFAKEIFYRVSETKQ